MLRVTATVYVLFLRIPLFAVINTIWADLLFNEQKSLFFLSFSHFIFVTHHTKYSFQYCWMHFRCCYFILFYFICERAISMRAFFAFYVHFILWVYLIPLAFIIIIIIVVCCLLMPFLYCRFLFCFDFDHKIRVFVLFYQTVHNVTKLREYQE